MRCDVASQFKGRGGGLNKINPHTIAMGQDKIESVMSHKLTLLESFILSERD